MAVAYSAPYTLLGLLWTILDLQRHSLDAEPMEAPAKTCKPSILRLSWLFRLD
jgi:hypothetical protein